VSSGEQRGPRLPERAEALLADWPAPQKSEAYWEERALGVTNQLGEVAQGSTPDALLEAPLPAEPGEGAQPEFLRAAPAAAARPQSLAELARAVRDSKPEESLKDIAAASLSLSSRARGEAAEVAARLQRAASAAVTSTPLPDKTKSEAPTVPVSARAAEVEKDAAAKAPPKMVHVSKPSRSRGVAPVLMAAAGALALAATALIFVRAKTQSSEPIAPGEPVAAVASAAAPHELAPPQAEQPRPLAVEELPGRPGPVAQAPVPALRPQPSGERLALRATKPGAKSEKVVLEESAPKPAPAEAPKPAASVDPNEPPLRPADGKSAELPDKPAAGAVQAAINNVKASAAACIAAHDQPSTAVITFGSDGRVRSVVVGGGAANTPAAGCIRAALTKARVAPFAKDTFSVSTTIRPP